MTEARNKFDDVTFKIADLTFTVRRTSHGRLFLAVEDIPRRHQGVLCDEELLLLLEAVKDGFFDGDSSEWLGRDGRVIRWWFAYAKEDRSHVVIEKPDGYRLWLSVYEFDLLVKNLKRLLNRVQIPCIDNITPVIATKL